MSDFENPNTDIGPDPVLSLAGTFSAVSSITLGMAFDSPETTVVGGVLSGIFFLADGFLPNNVTTYAVTRGMSRLLDR